MVDFATNIGEEYIARNDLNGVSVEIALFNQATDSLGEDGDLSDITTEPGGANYARQSSSVTAEQISGNYGIATDSQVAFDVSDSTQDVDHCVFIANFQSSVAGDGSANDHVIAVASLSQMRDLSQLDDLNFPAGDLDLQLD